MRYKQSSWDVVALQGQFAARIREFCTSSMTVRAWRCGDSTGTHGKAVQKHRALFNHYCWYSENLISPSAKKALPLRLQSQLLADEKSPGSKKDSGRPEWVANFQLCAEGQPRCGAEWQDQAAGMGLWAVGPAPLTGELPFTHAWGASGISVPGHASPDLDSKSQICSNVLHCCELPSVGGSGSRHRELGTARYGTAAPLHPTETHWHSSCHVLTTL